MDNSSFSAAKEIPIKNNYKPFIVSIILLLSDLTAITVSFYSAYVIRDILVPIMGGGIII